MSSDGIGVLSVCCLGATQDKSRSSATNPSSDAAGARFACGADVSIGMLIPAKPEIVSVFICVSLRWRFTTRSMTHLDMSFNVTKVIRENRSNHRWPRVGAPTLGILGIEHCLSSHPASRDQPRANVDHPRLSPRSRLPRTNLADPRPYYFRMADHPGAGSFCLHLEFHAKIAK